MLTRADRLQRSIGQLGLAESVANALRGGGGGTSEMAGGKEGRKSVLSLSLAAGATCLLTNAQCKRAKQCLIRRLGSNSLQKFCGSVERGRRRRRQQRARRSQADISLPLSCNANWCNWARPSRRSEGCLPPAFRRAKTGIAQPGRLVGTGT